MEDAAAFDKFCGRCFDVQDARTGSHPLGRPVGDQAATTMGILVREAAVDHVGDGLDLRCGCQSVPLGWSWFVFHLTHLVHVHKGIQFGRTDAGECANHGEAFALVPTRTGGDGADWAFGVARRRLPRCAAGSMCQQ